MVTPHMGKSRGVSGPSGETTDGTAPAEDTIQEVDIHIGGYGTRGGRVLDYGKIQQAAPEHGHTVHHYEITVRPLLGFRKGIGGASRDEVVGTGGD